ncbi:hypothetical protein GCM10027589_24950 [Actinocorallia lasiicapitis]
MPNDIPSRLIARRYRLETQVGRGGMGTVWQAFDEVLGRDVAVKEVILPFGLSDEERDLQHRRTFREARTAARLAHPGVVTVYDVVEEDDRPWIVMELIKASSLDKVIKGEGVLTPRRAARLGGQMLSALHAAHVAGVLHRDIKPSNVMLAPGDRAVLTDFGIAHATGDATLTATGLVMGSPAYIAPERARGRVAGPASDLWALGVTLYAMCEGRSPFERPEPMASLLAIISEDVPESPNAGPLNEVILGLLRKDPAERMTVHEAGMLLDEIAHGKGGAPTRPVERPQPVVIAQPAPLAPGDPTAREGSPRLGPATIGATARKSGRTGAIVAAIVLATGMIVGGIAWNQAQGDDKPDKPAVPVPAKTQKTSQPASPSPTASPSRSTTPSASASTTPSASSSATASAPATTTGFHTYQDDSGYSLLIPDGFTGPQSGVGGDHFYSPDRKIKIQIDQVASAGPSALADWQRSSARPAITGYRLVSVKATPDQPPVRGTNGARSADWEFTSTEGGVTMHTLNRGFVLPPRGYAILLRAPESEWAAVYQRMRPVYESFKGAS